MPRYQIELEIYRGEGGRPRADGSHPNVVAEGIYAWMYSRGYTVGQTSRYRRDLGLLCPWLVDSLLGVIRAV